MKMLVLCACLLSPITLYAAEADAPSGRVSMMGWGHYFETYRKCDDGRWRISSKRNTRLLVDDVPWRCT